MNWNITIYMWLSISGYILYKFGGLLTSTSRVYVNQLCTTGVDQRSGKYIYIRQVAVQFHQLCFIMKHNR